MMEVGKGGADCRLHTCRELQVEVDRWVRRLLNPGTARLIITTNRPGGPFTELHSIHPPPPPHEGLSRPPVRDAADASDALMRLALHPAY